MLQRWTRRQALLVSALAFIFLAGNAALAVVDDEPDEPKTTEKSEKGKKDLKPKGGKAGELKKYEEVITAKAKTSKGVFTVHRIDDKVYFEIPDGVWSELKDKQPAVDVPAIKLAGPLRVMDVPATVGSRTGFRPTAFFKAH